MRQALFENWELKIVSVAIAAVVWFLVVSADRSQLAFAAPVEYVGVPDDMVLVGDRRDSVEVQVQAARWAAARLTPANVRVRINLTGLKAGDNAVPVLPGEVETPAGVVVTRISPAWLRVTLAAAAVRSVRVVPQVRGTPEPGRTVRRVKVQPPMIELKGPRTTMEAQTAVETLPIDVTGSAETVTHTVGLVLPEAVYPTAQRTVQVTVDIRAEDGMRQRKSTSARR